jgi:translation initiation factor 3 subunit M
MERVAEPYSSTSLPLRSLSPTADLLATVASQLSVMAVDTENQVFIDGTFEDLAEELAAYIDNIKKVDEDTGLRSEVGPLLKANKKDDVLKKLVTASPALNAAPEKEFTAAYNLLVYLVVQSPNVNMFLPKVCENLSRPITSSPINGPGLALSVLTTLFNLLRPDNEVRFNVFQAILRLVKASGLFEMLRPQLVKLDTWIEQWDIDEEDQRKLFGQIADIAEDASEEELVPFTLYS